MTQGPARALAFARSGTETWVERLGVVGISWRHATAHAIASFTLAREERDARVRSLAAELEVSELVYLATCNRVELTFVADGRTPLAVLRRRAFRALRGRDARAGEAEHTLRAWQGEGAAEHLLVVAAGLDSARAGESEIAGQMREAVEDARAVALLGPYLELCFGEALRVARRVRPMTEGRVGRVSLAQIAQRIALDRLARTPGTAAVVGVSPMTTQCAHALAARGVPLVIVNRTLARAESLAASVGATPRALDAFRAAPDPVETMIVATSAPQPIFSRADLERLAARTPSGEAPLVIDLAIPPNVAPEAAAAADVPRVGMDEITLTAAVDRERAIGDLAEARAIVDDALSELQRRMAERLLSPVIAELHQRYRRTAAEGLERLFQKELCGLGEAERAAVRQWAETLARRFAHMPSVGLRDLAFVEGPGAVEVFLARSAPELAHRMQEAVSDDAAPIPVEQERGIA